MNAPKASAATVSLSDIAPALADARFSVRGVVDVPAHTARFAPIPTGLAPNLVAHLTERYPLGLYAHQSAAIDAYLAERDVCLATPTASGKSLPFMVVAAETLLRDPEARVLVLYPMRALIQDQSAKWKEFLAGLGLSHAVVDGGVPTDQRLCLLRLHRVILMTPDVAHAWLLGRSDEQAIRTFLDHVKLVVLDEAHVYQGVFGTNMAYLLRRMEAAAGPHRLLASTATIDAPADFLRQLAGRDVDVIGPEHDGAGAAARTIVHVVPQRGGFESLAHLISALARTGRRFLAFADSRKMVEQLVAASRRRGFVLDDAGDTVSDEGAEIVTDAGMVLPYRAGLESDDRVRIQQALADGNLAGVVATSAMELGIDIGEIDVVAMLGVPVTMKSFKQRLGRAGRRSASVCVLVDVDGRLPSHAHALREHLARPMEPSWLYLENRYLQYANALCAAVEARANGRRNAEDAFADLPEHFRQLLANELDPVAAIAEDLYSLKQRAENGPHIEFPMRTGVERTFQVVTQNGNPLGTLSFSQVLREAYPGAVYYYLAQPHRVRHFDHRNGRIVVVRERFLTTRPVRQSMVFPAFAGMYQLRRGDMGFVAEVPVQVSARVVGFIEQRGQRREQHQYGPGSPFHARDLGHFFATTGVCWFFPGRAATSEAVGGAVLRAFCETFGVHDGDVGVSVFHAKSSPMGQRVCQGLCLFDANHGSLRLTQQLVARFDEVLERAIATAEADGDARLAAELEMLSASVASTTHKLVPGATQCGAPVFTTDDDWMEVVLPGERAMLSGTDGERVVTVLGFRYTPRGPMYELVSEVPGVRWSVAAAAVQAIHDETRTQRMNLVTGEAA